MTSAQLCKHKIFTNVSQTMTVLLYISVFLLLSKTYAIDENEKVKLCRTNFTFFESHYINEHEGVWFPHYRTAAENNKDYECHTIFEAMSYDEPQIQIAIDVFLTKQGEVMQEPYTVYYASGPKRGILIDKEEVSGYGEFKIYNYIIKMNSDLRIRYVCTDYIDAKAPHDIVYIETRSSTPNLTVINDAVSTIQKAGFRIELENINQKNCKRPLDRKGYDSEEFH